MNVIRMINKYILGNAADATDYIMFYGFVAVVITIVYLTLSLI